MYNCYDFARIHHVKSFTLAVGTWLISGTGTSGEKKNMIGQFLSSRGVFPLTGPIRRSGVSFLLMFAAVKVAWWEAGRTCSEASRWRFTVIASAVWRTSSLPADSLQLRNLRVTCAMLNTTKKLNNISFIHDNDTDFAVCLRQLISGHLLLMKSFEPNGAGEIASPRLQRFNQSGPAKMMNKQKKKEKRAVL